MQTPVGKRKRISFAENVEALPPVVDADVSDSPKKKKVKKTAEDAPAIIDVADTSAEDDVWSKILSISKASGINYEDSIKDMLLEKLRAVVSNPTDETALNNYDEFMVEMSTMFEKLRRFPKMISKFLFCIRNDVVGLFSEIDMKVNNHKPWTQLLLPAKFMATVTPTISMLPTGQTIDLWVTIQHNLIEECVKKIFEQQDDAGVHYFLQIVVELLSEFLSSLKIFDSSVPISQIEKMAELIFQLQEDCLLKLANSLVRRKQDSKLLGSFLKLANTWVELYALLLLYNSRYKTKNKINSIMSLDYSNLDDKLLGESTVAFNLTCLHPYADEKTWCSLGDIILKTGHSSLIVLLVKLVAQKLKYLHVTESQLKFRGNSDNEINETVRENFRLKLRRQAEECAEFIWINSTSLLTDKDEWFCMVVKPTKDIFLLASEYLQPQKMIELASNIVEKIDSSYVGKGNTSNSILDNCMDVEKKLDPSGGEGETWASDWVMEIINENPIFCSALVLQVTGEIMRRLHKMKLLEKKFLKHLNHQVLTEDNQSALILRFAQGKSSVPSDNEKKDGDGGDAGVLQSYLNFVNDFVENQTNESKMSGEEFSPALILNLLHFLHDLPFEEYNRNVKTFLCLFSISVFIAIYEPSNVSEEDDDDMKKELRRVVGNLIEKSARESKGNVILFGVKWHQLFHWVRAHVRGTYLSEILMSVCLRNIYVSPKLVEEFQPELNTLFDDLSKSKSMSGINVGLNVLEFLVQELSTAANTHGTKWKLTPVIENHTRKLTQLVVAILAQQEEDVIDVFIESIDQYDENAQDDHQRPSSSSELIKAKAEILEWKFRGGLLSRQALQALSSTTPSNQTNNNKKKKKDTTEEAKKAALIVNPEDEALMKAFEGVISICLHSSLSFLKKCQKSKKMRKLLKNNEELWSARNSAWAFVYSVCEGRVQSDFGGDVQLPKDFLKKLWSLCLGLRENQFLEKNQKNSGGGRFHIRQKHLCPQAYDIPRVIYQLCSADEFAVIAESMMEETKILSTAEGQVDGARLATVTRLVIHLIDVELSIEKKRHRTLILEEFLAQFLCTSLHWKEFLPCHYISVLDLQLKILRRRNPLCSLEALANCFTSVTAVPLETITDVSVFRKVFCRSADLLNAFVYNRLDVVSFRSHVALQCFESLVRRLTEKADQTNKLTDGEIFELRYCSHAMERICQSAKLGQKEFSRISPYFVAILMRQLEVCTVYPAVKIPLMSGCYKLLDLCDEHAVAQLNSLLTVGAREIFKTTFDLYKKFYRYTGKV